MEAIAKLSIRARVAFGILCLENSLKHFNYKFSNWNIILLELWKFTNSDVGKWHENMSEMIPFSVLEEIAFVEKGCDYIDNNKHDKLQTLYKGVNKDVLKIINLIFEIGTRDLYSSISNDSPDTLKYINNIIDILKLNNIEVPSLKHFVKYNITQNNGWGVSFERNEIID